MHTSCSSELNHRKSRRWQDLYRRWNRQPVRDSGKMQRTKNSQTSLSRRRKPKRERFEFELCFLNKIYMKEIIKNHSVSGIDPPIIRSMNDDNLVKTNGQCLIQKTVSNHNMR